MTLTDTRVDNPKGPGARAQVQRFGTFLSNMVMPNIGAFIAWGLITSLFIKVGWINLAAGYDALADLGGLAGDSWVAQLGGWGSRTVDGEEVANTGIVGPMITYLLPLLIGYTGGRMVYNERGPRGGVVGAIATMGVIAGTSIPMFMGAMIMGPLGGWTMKKIDAIWDGKIRPGFEMLVDNFSAGIWGMILAIFGFFALSPVVTAVSTALGAGVQFLVNNSLLPLTSVLIEPAKILFLNNAINHGVLTPLGLAQSQATGQSILFLLEANPGPGLGILLAFMLFGKGAAKASAPGAAIIHFLGGIHEIYFPYVLMKPIMIIAAIAGGASGVLMNVLFNGGLRAPAAPGSIIAVYSAVTPQGILGVTLSWIVAAAVSFLVGALLLRISKDKGEGDLGAATASMESMKGKKSSVSGALGAGAAVAGPVKNIVFACDAGMGSSAMGASVLRKKIQDAGFGDIKVVNQAIANLTDSYDIIVTHQDLAARARPMVPSATMFTVDNFMGSPVYDDVVEAVKLANSGSAPAAAAAPAASAPKERTRKLDPNVLPREAVRLGLSASNKEEAIRLAGQTLVAIGAAEEGYIAGMLEREHQVSTFMGNGVAIPHGTNESRGHIRKAALGFLQFPGGVDWNGKTAYVAIPIASNSDEHVGILSALATVLADKSKAERLRTTTSVDEVLDLLAPEEE
ncbi:PTS mannitol transporter subunit IICBA [Propioniciclava sinopodophylli]|uniref:PTS mannitol transporter subunit IICBA n=1 Tax=Propioniciclava sinopodophylli TaxID=1837344 RepID=UPI002492E80E|nr:PTS mannitol transporter subunit IICBA [Propioniciclava sinopodophylli]